MTTHQHHPVSRAELLELIANPEIPLADIDTSQVVEFTSTEQARLMHEVILALRNFDTEQLQEMVALVNHIASSAASEAADTATTDEAESVTTPSIATSDAGDTTSSEATEADTDANPATADLAETETAATDADAQLESPALEQKTATSEPSLEWNFDTATDLDADNTRSFQDLFGMASADPATAAPAPTSGLNVFDEMLAQQEREQFLAPMQNAVSQNDSIVWDTQDDSPLVFNTDSTATLDLTSSAATDVLELENEAPPATADSLGSQWGTSAPETATTQLEDESETTFNAEWLSLFGGGETGAVAQDASSAPANTLALNPEVANPTLATDSSTSSAPTVSTSDGWNFDSDSAEQGTTSSNSDPFSLSTNETSWDFSGVWGDIPAWDEPVNPQSIITPTESAGDAQQQDTSPTVADIAALFDDGDVAASEISSTIPGLLGSDDDGTSSFLGHQDNSPATAHTSADAAPRSEITASPFFATPAAPTPSTSASDNGFAFNSEIFSWDGENDGGWGSQPDPLSILGDNADNDASQSTPSNPPPNLGVIELFGEIDWGVDVADPEATPAPAPASTATPTPIATSVADTPVTDTPAPTSLFTTSDADDPWGGFTLDSNSAHEMSAEAAPTSGAQGATSNDSSPAPTLNLNLATDEASSKPADVAAPASATTSPADSPVDGAEGADVAETPSVATSSATTSASTATTPELNCADTSLELAPADSSFPTDPFGLLGGDNSASNSASNSSNAYGTPSLTGSELSPSLNEEPTSSSTLTATTPAVATTPAREPASNPWSLLDTLGSFGGAAAVPAATTPASTAVPATAQETGDSATPAVATTPAPEPASNPWNLLDDVLGDYKPSTSARTQQEATSTASANTPRQDELGTGVAEPTGWFGSPSMSGASSWADVASDTLVTNNAVAVHDELDPTAANAALDPEADLAFDTVGEALAYLSTARRTEAGQYRPHSVQELRILLTDKEISLGDLDLSQLKSLHGAFANIPSERGKIPPMLVADIEEQQAQILIQDSSYPLPLVYDLTPNWTGIESLDFSHINDLSYCFAYQFGFNNGLTTWKVDHVTSLRGMFRGCINFRSNLNHWNTARVQDMSGVFALCFHYNQPVTWNTSSCTTMRAMFFSCPHFNQPVRFDTGAVTDMGQMFMNCMSFNQELNFITTQVTDMSQMLAGCRKFNSSVSLDTTLVQNFQGMFANCSSFDQEVKFSTASATNMAEMFANCSSFTGINFRFSGTRNVKDMTRMFAGCGKFAGNLMLSTNTVEQATEMFAGCRIPDGNRFTLSQPLPEGQELGIDEQHLNFLTRN